MKTNGSSQASPYKPLVPGCTVAFEVVQAQRFVLVDKTGRIHGGLGFTDEGQPTLRLVEDHGDKLVTRADMTLTPEGPQLGLEAANGLAVALVAKHGWVAFYLQESRQKPRLIFALDDHGILHAKTFDTRGKPVRFVRRTFPKPTIARLGNVLGPLAKAGKKGAFIRALAEELDIHESAHADGLWAEARKAFQAGGKTKHPRQRSRDLCNPQ